MNKMERPIGLAVEASDLPAGYTPEIVRKYFDELDKGRLLNADELEIAVKEDFPVGGEVELTNVKGVSCRGKITGIDFTHSELMIEVIEVNQVESGLRRVIKEVRFALETAQTRH